MELALQLSGIPPLLLSVTCWVCAVFASIGPKVREVGLTFNSAGDTDGAGVTGGCVAGGCVTDGGVTGDSEGTIRLIGTFWLPPLEAIFSMVWYEPAVSPVVFTVILIVSG